MYGVQGTDGTDTAPKQFIALSLWGLPASPSVHLLLQRKQREQPRLRDSNIEETINFVLRRA